MTPTEIERAMAAPDQTFRHPSEVLDSDASDDEKIAILTNWKNELQQLQTATEENMSREAGLASVDKPLEAVTKALCKLGVGESGAAH